MSELSHLKGEETKPLSTSFNVSSSSQNDTKDDKKYNKDSSSSSQSSSVKLIFFFILSIILYLLSLKGCDGTQTYCLVTLNPSFFSTNILLHPIISYLHLSFENTNIN